VERTPGFRVLLVVLCLEEQDSRHGNWKERWRRF
jgi:hypothetical protein